jgi:hypothetical protein
MPKAKKGTTYVCGVCGTTLLVTEDGVGILEDIVCCGSPMECEYPARMKATKRKTKKKAKRKK